MNVEISSAFLLDVATGQALEAELWDAITERQLADWEGEWTPALMQAIQNLNRAGIERRFWPQSRHWDWRRKADAFKGLLSKPGFSVMCQDMTQGMMIVDTLSAARLSSQTGKPLVYIEFLENAPWNRKGLVLAEPRFQGVGSLLMRAAIELSLNEDFKGRIGLHSLPQSDTWYANTCGMTDLGVDAQKEGLRYFEMTPEQSQAFINKGNQP